MKATSCIVGPNDTVLKPRGSTKLDWEVELGVVIGNVARYVSEADAPATHRRLLRVNDLSERAFQLERGGQWDKGKGCDTFGPLGPWLVTPDEVGDPANLSMWLDVNGTRRQNGSTRTMIFKPHFLVSYLSQFMSLHPGDVITTGTPPGVGMGIKPEPDFPERGRCHGARHREARQPAPGRGAGVRSRMRKWAPMTSSTRIADLRANSRGAACRARCSTTSIAARTTNSPGRAIATDLRAITLRQRVMVDVSEP